MHYILSLVLFGLAYSMGRTSNGMTTGRVAFNIYTPILAIIVGAAVGAISMAYGNTAADILIGAGDGLFGGFAGLAVARWQRGGW